MTKKRLIWFALMIVVKIVIFVFSNQNGKKSHSISNAVAETVKVEGNQWQEASTMPLLFGFNLRKWAHLIMFGILGLTAWGWLVSLWKAIGVCYLYTCFDEIHQLFISGRRASIVDTFIDAIGFGIVIVLCFVFYGFKDF
jgi:VanZ family protein